MIIPACAVITSFVDFLVSFLILLGMMAWFRFWPDWRILSCRFSWPWPFWRRWAQAYGLRP